MPRIESLPGNFQDLSRVQAGSWKASRSGSPSSFLNGKEPVRPNLGSEPFGEVT